MGKRAIVNIIGREGQLVRRARAEIHHRGIFAIHRTTDSFLDGYWTLTHIPTGWNVTRWCPSRAAALRLLRRIRPMVTDWLAIKREFGAGLPPSKVKRIQAAMRAECKRRI